MSKHLSPAYQLYSAREDASNDLEGVLDQLSRMGYEGVEFAGFFEKTAKEVRKLLKHTGLKAVSSHVPLQQIRDDTQSVLDYHEELECGCIAVPYLAEEDRPGQPGFARVLETLYTFGRQCKKRGIVLLYHNHDFEFAQISGMTALDFLYAAVPASVLKCELDYIREGLESRSAGELYERMKAFSALAYPGDAPDARAARELSQLGQHHYNRRDYAAALKLLRAAAEFGCDGEAQNCLGLIYNAGDGVRRSDLVSLYWFDRAADRVHGLHAACGALVRKRRP